MKLILCPEVYDGTGELTVFIGGGISNCPDWQKEIVERFKHFDDDLVLFNPRRTSFAIEDPAESDFQIQWEFNHLQRSRAIIFWFPFQTLCPITLFELGVYAALEVPLFVGCHPAYQRKFDVKKQLELLRPDVTVHDNWQPLVKHVESWYNRNR